jgi:hypothetical protein
MQTTARQTTEKSRIGRAVVKEAEATEGHAVATAVVGASQETMQNQRMHRTVARARRWRVERSVPVAMTMRATV